MNSKAFIVLLLVLCFAVSFSGLCDGKDQKTGLTVKRIAFTRDKGGRERIAVFCNQSCVPELSSLEGENPRVVMDIEGVFLVQPQARNVNTKGKMVKRVRSYLDKRTKRLRVVLDMAPSIPYLVHPRQDPSGNRYMLTISEQKPGRSMDEQGSHLPQDMHITILNPDLRPGEQGGRLREAVPSPEKGRGVTALKDAQLVEQGRSQLNAGEFAAAVDTFTQILAANPRDSVSYRLRGNAYDNLVDRQKAMEDWMQAARLGDITLQSYLDFLQVKWRENSAP
jgi:hypothetical protein